jgi:TRAP-type mannitol/chloroaromatic compound transport system substrate-binding protein
LPWEDVEVALQTGDLDGLAWSRITEDYTLGWSKVAPYFLTNNISGAWVGHFFANMERWDEVPAHLKQLLQTCFDQSHYHRQWWYWAGEAKLRVEGPDMELTSLPSEDCAKLEAATHVFWDESELKAKVVSIIRA